MRFTVTHNLNQTAARVRAAQGRLEQDRKDLLTKIGALLLSEASQAYRVKARGGAGSDGITWAKLDRKTLEIRVRRRADARRIVSQRRDLAAQNKRLTRKNQQGQRRANTAKRAELMQKLQALIDREASRHEIGVDKGLQRASLSPGFQVQDGRGGGLFDVQPTSVTIGIQRSYSKFFDETRPILPEQLPPAWQRKCEELMRLWAERILQETIG